MNYTENGTSKRFLMHPIIWLRSFLKKHPETGWIAGLIAFANSMAEMIEPTLRVLVLLLSLILTAYTLYSRWKDEQRDQEKFHEWKEQEDN